MTRRSKWPQLEEWAHLVWRRGQIDLAALLLGAAEAQLAGRGERLGNEQRLLAAVAPRSSINCPPVPLRPASPQAPRSATTRSWP